MTVSAPLALGGRLEVQPQRVSGTCSYCLVGLELAVLLSPWCRHVAAVPLPCSRHVVTKVLLCCCYAAVMLLSR